MEQLSAYGEDDQPTPKADLESGQMKTLSLSVSAPPDLSQDGDLAPLPSIAAGPMGPVTCHQDLPPPASLPVLAGSQDLAGVLPVPLPPEEPTPHWTLQAGLCPIGSAACRCGAPSGPRHASAALPSPFPTYEVLALTPRYPSPAPHLCMPLPGRVYVPPPQAWSCPRRGCTILDLNRHLLQIHVPPAFSSSAPATLPAPS